MDRKLFSQIVFCLFAISTLTPWISSSMALAMGVFLALTLGNPFLAQIKPWTPRLLQTSVMGLGAGMNLLVVAKVGFHGIGYTVAGIAATLLLGKVLNLLLKTENDVSILITAGTAICGGSAIAAVAPVIRAKDQDISVALATVFILNAVALFLFPFVGHNLNLSENQFGLWSALAIHDTSSVVGATMQYGKEALEIGTTIKLARALWIMPIALLFGYLNSKKSTSEGPKGTTKKPWFILGFVMAAALVTWIPDLQSFGHQIESIAKRFLVLTLFLIGAGLSQKTLKSVGWRPFAQGLTLWMLVASGTLIFIYTGVIQ